MSSRRQRGPTASVDGRGARAIQEGYPWIWPESLRNQGRELRPGEEVELLDPVGGFLAWALAEGSQASKGPALRILSLDPRAPTLSKLLFGRVAAARRLRKRCVPPGTDAYRLVNGEGDHLPGLVVDRYGPLLVVRPDSPAWTPHIGSVVAALQSEAGPGQTGILLRDKEGGCRVLTGKAPANDIVITEEGRRYLVRPTVGQKTGFFLDQRPNRSMVQELVKAGDCGLNLFSYTGGFSVAMALGGAERVLSVDVSESILADCEAQFPLNGLAPGGHEVLAADIFDWLPGFARSEDRPRFDLVVCDPPALARKKSDLPAARKAYRRLHEGVAPLLAKAGVLVTASCTARLGADELLEDAQAGLTAGGRSVRSVLRFGGAGPDHPISPGFPEGRYLSCLTLALD